MRLRLALGCTALAAAVLLAGCSAQAGKQAQPLATELVGTWASDEVGTWTFEDDGALLINGQDSGRWRTPEPGVLSVTPPEGEAPIDARFEVKGDTLRLWSPIRPDAQSVTLTRQ